MSKPRFYRLTDFGVAPRFIGDLDARGNVVESLVQPGPWSFYTNLIFPIEPLTHREWTPQCPWHRYDSLRSLQFFRSRP
jgi:hypothetical protein